MGPFQVHAVRGTAEAHGVMSAMEVQRTKTSTDGTNLLVVVGTMGTTVYRVIVAVMLLLLRFLDQARVFGGPVMS